MNDVCQRASRVGAPIETWIFDLDNTLYPASSDLFPQISARMGGFIARRFDLDADAAGAMQKRLFRAHGTTLRGLMVEHGVDPHDFMAYVHDVDLSKLGPAAPLDAALAALPGRKLIHTNGSVDHAERVLDRLGLARHFEAVFDIVAADFVPKPERVGYETLIQRFGVRPARAAMVEDMARNLKPAAELGMLTLWVRTDNDWAVDGAVGDWVHHRTNDLAGWLANPRD
jgi:putative hydrolase of the HAD superfamily